MSINPYEPLTASRLSKGPETVEPEKAELPVTEEPVADTEETQTEAYVSEGNPDPAEEEVEWDLVGISNGTIKEVIEWVGDDKDRAEQMMTLEIGKGSKSRSTLVNALHEVLS